MYHKWKLFIFVSILISIFSLDLGTAQAAGTTYYLDITHPNARDRPRYGKEDAPWKTLEYALPRLTAGDTLLIRAGTYPTDVRIELNEPNSGTESNPITVKAYPDEEVVFSGDISQSVLLLGAKWWNFEDIIFESLNFVLGDSPQTVAKNITFHNCFFRRSHQRALRILYAEDVVIQKSRFRNIQADNEGEDITAIVIPYYAKNITIQDSKFIDISSDGIQVGNRNIEIRNITIEGNEFIIKRNEDDTLQNVGLQDKWGNAGENAIDVKTVQGPVIIRNNIISGFRPTIKGQNASGADGEGIVIHFGAQNVTVEQNLFIDNTFHVVVIAGPGWDDGSTRDVIIRNNIFKNSRPSKLEGAPDTSAAIWLGYVDSVKIYHNTFYDNEVFLTGREITDSVFKNNIIFKGRATVNDETLDVKANYNAWSRMDNDVPDVLQGGKDLELYNLKLDEDLQPLANSKVINQGQDMGLSEDYESTPRVDGLPDLGAFEYTGLTVTPTDQTIPPGETTSYKVFYYDSEDFVNPVNLEVTNPAPNELDFNFDSKSDLQSGDRFSLVVTSKHDPEQIQFSQLYTILMTVSDGRTSQVIELTLQIGEQKGIFLPMVINN